MKYAILTAAIAILATGCQKKEKCWECLRNSKTYVSTPTMAEALNIEVKDPKMVCDMTEGEMQAYEKANSGTVYEQSDTLYARVVTTMTCQ